MVYVITPTYNEKESLPILVEKIFALKIPDLKMIVVDDNSPDGTGALAEKLGKTHPIRVIHRAGKKGLGTAYVTAFKEILKGSASTAATARQAGSATNYSPSEVEGPQYIIQMDADLSHDPAAIPTLVKKIRHSEYSEESQEILRSAQDDTCDLVLGSRSAQDDTCDLVLGSRYIKGGRTANWGFIRKIVSRFGNFYARAILGLPYRDLTGGFKCFRAEVLKDLNLDSLSSVGYNFQIETTYRAHKKGYKICEIPITFTERKTGKSKFNLGIMLEAFWKVIALKFERNHPEPIRLTQDKLREGP